MDGLFKAYPLMKPFQKDIENFVYDNGYTETLLGFRRYFGKLGDLSKKDYSKALREAYNMPIQGTSADMTKQALNNIYDWIRTNKDDITTEDVKIIGTVHDEIVFEIKKCEPDRMVFIINSLKELMEKPIMDMPLDQLAEPEIVDPHNIYNVPESFASKICKGWGEKQDYDKWIREVNKHVNKQEGEEDITVF